MCYDSCEFWAGVRCTKERGMPCPRNFGTEEEYQAALEDAEYAKEQMKGGWNEQ